MIPSAARIADILAGGYTGAHVIVRGWVRTRRDSKGGFSFIELNDGSCMRSLQIVAPAELPNYADEVATLHAGASIEAHGSVVESPGAKQPFELQAEEVRLIGGVDPARYPLHKQRLSFEHLRGVAHLRPRTNTFGAVTRVRNAAAMAIHRFFQSRGFLWIATPIITGSDCEGAGEQFQVTTFDLGDVPRGGNGAVDYTHDFFGRKAYLTVSGQLEVENFACALGNVYTFGPTFRAENSNTTRHLSEFWMVEPELAFADLEDDMALAEAFVKEVIAATLEQCAEDIGFFGQRVQNGLREGLEAVAEAEFTRLPYSEAIEVLQGAGNDWEYPVAWGSDLQAEHEHFLTEQHCGGPVIVYDWPAAIKPFYMRVNDDGRTVGAMDVLVPRFGEIIGGSQREERLDVLERRMEQGGMECETYWWYCDLRRYGTVPHAGFGLGFERLLQFMTGMANIRDVIPFARTPKSADF